MTYPAHDGVGEFAIQPNCDFYQDGFCTWGKDKCIGHLNCPVEPSDNDTPNPEDFVPPEEPYYATEEDNHPWPESWIRMIREKGEGVAR